MAREKCLEHLSRDNRLLGRPLDGELQQIVAVGRGPPIRREFLVQARPLDLEPERGDRTEEGESIKVDGGFAELIKELSHSGEMKP